MLVKRATQFITSRFGRRKGFKRPHLGIDLRSVHLDTGNRLPIVAPEEMRIIRVVHQIKWGYTIVVTGVLSGYTLKFTHVNPADSVIKGAIFAQDDILGFTMVTPYMIECGYGEHLHFETWLLGIPRNPVKYLTKRQIPYTYKHEEG